MGKMKRGILFLALGFIALGNLNGEECCEEKGMSENGLEVEKEKMIRFKRPASYENSVIRDPIEREPVVSYPSSFESSFYEQMSR